MNLKQLESLLSDPAALEKRGRDSALRSAKNAAENELRAATQELLNGATVTTQRIVSACEAWEKIKSKELDF